MMKCESQALWSLWRANTTVPQLPWWANAGA